MSSKYLSSLSKEEYDNLTKKLHEIQHGICYICQDKIDLQIHTTNIDHINPQAKDGKDNEDNFAVTHESCNKTKQDSNLKTARLLALLRKIQEQSIKETGKPATLHNFLLNVDGSKFNFKYKLEGNQIKYSFSENGDNKIYSSPLFKDKLSNETTCFIEVPIQYLFHDKLINPRGINESISKLVKEFEKGNPQLHVSLARLDDDKIKIFDGQHKAVAQILLGQKTFVIRLFLNPDIDRLIETNTNAGSTLRQIAFDKAIMRQLNNTLYAERIKKYQEQHSLEPDDISFSEQDLVAYFKGEGVNIKKYIHDSVKNAITHSEDNKLKDFIDFEGRAKELPISYSAYDKTILTTFIDPKLVMITPINYRTLEGLNPREVEINQIVRLLNIIAEEIYIGKFSPEIGVYRIENKIIDKKDKDITPDHLTAYRISKEEILAGWIPYLDKVIVSYFDNTGKIYEKNKLFQYKFDDQLWSNIRNFVSNLRDLPLWKDKSMADTIFSGKNPYHYWQTIFSTAKSPDGAQVLGRPLNFQEMIKSNPNKNLN
jgi:hypothetical protein